MPTKIYLIGDLVYVEKTGEAVVAIPQSRAKYMFIGTLSSDPNVIPEFTNVEISDLLIGTSMNDTIVNIKNGLGSFVGDFLEVKKYLSGFILRGDSIFLDAKVDVNIDGVATSEKQSTQILDEKVADYNLAIIGQNIIKELKEIKRILTKIYQ